VGDKTQSRRHRSAALGVAVGGFAALGHAFPSVCVLGQWSPVALRQLPGGLCRWRGPSWTGTVGLTFDDGPSPETTPRTLELLDGLGMRATFFVLGSRAVANAELIAEIRRRGHGIGLHGDRHEHHLLRTPRWIRRDTAAAVSVLDRLGVQPRWYRPPYGQLTATTLVEARRHGMEVVLWSAWGREWAETEPRAVMDRLAPKLEDGAVVLLHDTDVNCPPGTAARTHAVLALLADELSRRALRAVDLDTLLLPRPVLGAVR
jgi:peptidoglycan/xylan/chitin deacetylase (PgdA/CDA1 family)